MSAKFHAPIFFLATLLTVSAHGDEASDIEKWVDYIVSYKGNCKIIPANIGKAQTGTCKGMIAMVYKYGRVNYIFPYEEDGYTKVITFSGGVDRQPLSSHYELDIDAVMLDETRVAEQIRMTAKGLCSMDGDPHAVAIFRCAAVLSDTRVPARSFEFVFESEGVASYATSATP